MHGACNGNLTAVCLGLIEEASLQVRALSLCFLREMLGIVQNLGLTDAERKDVSAIIDTLQRYVDGYLNETV